MFNVIFVDDDADSYDKIAEYLGRYQIASRCLSSIESLRESLAQLRPQILVLDQFVCGRDMLTEIHKIRPIFEGGIVVFSENQNTVDRIVALECGADDFILKTSDPREFVARLRAVLRRVKGTQSGGGDVEFGQTENAPDLGSDGGWEFDGARGTVSTPRGVVLRLTGTEFDFLNYMERKSGEVLSRDEISLAVFRRPYCTFDRAVDNMLSRIRKLLDPHLNGDSPFRSVRGQGYIFAGLKKRHDIEREGDDVSGPCIQSRDVITLNKLDVRERIMASSIHESV